jgi:hypothetical protein
MKNINYHAYGESYRNNIDQTVFKYRRKVIEMLNEKGILTVDIDVLLSKIADNDFFNENTMNIEKKVNSILINQYHDPYYGVMAKNEKHKLSKDDEYVDVTDDVKMIILIIDLFRTVFLYQSFGDTFGYDNGQREFNGGNQSVTAEYTNILLYDYINRGGIIDSSMKGWKASDDTIMYLETYKILLTTDTVNDFGQALKEVFVKLHPELKKRHIGNITNRSLNMQKNIKWNELPYNSEDIGNGACMRTGCIGLLLFGEHNRSKLISYAIESSRITHNSATGILSGVTSALFTAFAVEHVNINEWPQKMIDIIKSKIIDTYIEGKYPQEFESYISDKMAYVGYWEIYIGKRFSGKTKREMPIMTNLVNRVQFFINNFSRDRPDFPGGRGHDSTIMAYDALLESGGILEKALIYSCIHIGDTDTIGSMTMSWFCLYHISKQYYELLYDRFIQLEYFEEITELDKLMVNKIIRTTQYDLKIEITRQILEKY